MKLKCWRSPKVIRRNGSLEGEGLFALQAIKAGELLAVKTGHVVDESYIKGHQAIIMGSHVQITDDLFFAPTTQEELTNTLIGYNHSCEPSAYIEIPVLKALRKIHPGEEITVDYATCFTSDTQEFDCSCKTPSCRKHIKPSQDWKNPSLQSKYKGYFASFIQEKINHLQQT